MHLGPFFLQQKIGAGGMGEVWRGFHEEQREPVAIKVLTQLQPHSGHTQASSRAAFREEARAVASLDHPSIIRVFDYGVVPSGLSLPAGSPFLVMELAEGSLREWRQRLPWPPLRRILLSLLDALAHAHARGMIHRDIKPANVLLAHKWSQIKLADFGLVFGLDQDEQDRGAQEISGTLGYMAPEQFEHMGHLYGPWTDLYAFGCLAYAMLMGKPPFGTRGTMMEMMFQHNCEPVPPLQVEQELPSGFEAWLLRLLEKEPSRRFQRAADAAWALLELEGLDAQTLAEGDELRTFFHKRGTHSPSSEEPAADEALSSALPTLQTLIHTQRHDEQLGGATISEPAPSQPAEEAGLVPPFSMGAEAPQSLPESELPPFPKDWRRQRHLTRKAQLTGVGLGLYGVRTIPVVGREQVRDQLWDALHQVRSTHQPQLVILTGPAGYGKSRLAEWLLHRAHEVGTAHTLKALHSPMAGVSGGLELMFARFLRCHGMESAELEESLPDLLSPYGLQEREERQAIQALLSQAGQTSQQRDNAKQRYTLMLRMLRRFSCSRPALLWLDDAHWGVESLGFVHHLLELDLDDAPLLFVLTVREEALVERPQEEALLSQLAQHPRAQRIEVGPLQEEDWSILVRELLGLEGDVAAQVEERAAGNPLFAIQMIGDWIQRGSLVPGSHGFQLKPGVQISLPDDLHSVWARRIEQLLASRSQGEREALELAAVLGQDIDGVEWREALRLHQLTEPLSLVEALLESRLARCDFHSPSVGWSFVHGMLRESLIRQAQESGRLERHHRICAEMLEHREGRSVGERRALHLLAGGALQDAIEPLRQAIRGRILSGETRNASALLHDWEALLNQLALPETSAYWGERSFIEAQIAFHTRRYEETREWLERAEKGARTHQWQELLVEVLMLHSRLAWNEGRSEGSFAPLTKAEELLHAIQRPDLKAEVHQSLGNLLCAQGRLDEATPWLEKAREGFAALGDVYGMGMSYRNLANIARQSGALDEAAQLTDQAKLHFEACHSREDIADAINLQGEIARLQGDLHAAEGYYRESLKRFRALESSAADICELNLGMTLISLQRYAEARDLLEECLRSSIKHGRSLLQGISHICLLPCIVDAEDWDVWGQHLHGGNAILTKANLHDVDAAGSAELAGELALEKGQHDVAKSAYLFAQDQWRALQRQEDVDRLQAILDPL